MLQAPPTSCSRPATVKKSTRSSSRIVHHELDVKGWLAALPSVASARPGACVDCGAASQPTGGLLGLHGHGFRDRQLRGPPDADSAKPVEKAAGYLVKNTRYLHYDRALAEGLPIATGVIEGACRYLVKDRMGRTDAIWSMIGAEAVLRLRALRASDDFDDYWLFYIAKEHERTHVSRYADGAVPNPLPRKPPQLQLVKRSETS